MAAGTEYQIVQPAPESKQILVVDSDLIFASSARMFLHLDGHAVVLASDAFAALERFRASPFDLLITGYKMPGMSGLELAARVKRLAPNCPVLLVSSFADEIGRRPPGVDAVLFKPFSRQGLRQAATDLLDLALGPPCTLAQRRASALACFEALD